MRHFIGLPAAIAVRCARRSTVVRMLCALVLLLSPVPGGVALLGQVAQLAYTSGATITVGASGTTPTAVAVDGAGNVYSLVGTTVYKATPSGTSYTVAATNITASSGSYLAADVNGLVYVATSVSASSTAAYLTRWTPSGSTYTATPLLSNSSNSDDAVAGLAVDPAGNALIVVTNTAYTNGPGSTSKQATSVQEVFAGSSSNTVLVTLSNAATYQNVNAFTVDSNDNLFFSLNYDTQSGIITEIPRSNGTYSANAQVTAANTLCTNCYISSLGADSGGNIYSSYQGSYSGGVERYLPSGTNTYSAGSVYANSLEPTRLAVGATGIVYTIGSNTQEAPSNNIVIYNPPQASTFGNYNLDAAAVTDSLGGATFILDKSATYQGVSFVGQAGTTDFSGGGSPITCGAGVSCSSGTTYTAGTAIYVPGSFIATAVGARYGVLNLNSTSGTIASAYLTGTATGPLLTYLPAAVSTVSTTTTLRSLGAIGTDLAGNAYVIDTALQQLLKVVPGTGQVTTLALGLGVTSSTAAAPALDAAGNVYYVQSDPAHPGFFEVARINTPDGGSTYPSTSTGPTRVAASLASPQGVAVDASGDVFVLDSSTNQVTEYVNIYGSILPGYSSYLPRVVLSNLTNVHGLAVGADGSLYIASGNGLFRSTLVNGIYGTPVNLTSSSTTAYSVALDSVGNIYVDDAGNDRVLRLSPNGSTVTTLYTSPTTINGVAATPAGNVLLAGDNGTLGLLTLSTPPSLTFASTPVGGTSSDSPKTLTITNTGNAQLGGSNGNSYSITSPFLLSSGASTCLQAFQSSQVILAQDASCNYLVSFSPTASGAITGSLLTNYYSKNGNGALVTLKDTLTGTGSQSTPTVQVSNTTLAYGSAATTTLTATVSYSGSTAPTGAVTFTVGSSTQTSQVTTQATPQQATCNITSTGVRTCTVTLSTTSLSPGSYPISVSEAADSTYQAASGSGSLTVTKATPTVTASAPSSTYGNTSLALSASITYASAAGFQAPSGPVTFSVDNGAATAATCSSASSTSLACAATYNASSLAAGNHTLTATVAADTNYVATTSPNATFTVNAAAAPTAAVPASTITYGTASAQLTASFAYSGSTAPSGAVTFTVNSATYTAACATSTASPRSCSFTYTSSALPAGTYPVQATEAADSNYAASTGNGTLTVTKATPAVTASAPSSTYGNTSLALSAQVSYSGSATPSGAVTFSVDGGPAVAATCSASPNNVLGCSATYDASSLAAGTHTLSATIATDTNYATATSSNATFTVNVALAPAATVPASTITYGAASTQLTATFAYSGKTAPSGQVTFAVNNASYNAACVAGTASPRSCSYTFSSATLAPGSYAIQVTEVADSNYAASTGNGTLTVSKATPSIQASAPSATYGDTVLTLSAPVNSSGGSGAQAPTGAVTFSVDGGAALAATCNLSSTSGARVCTASYNPSSLAVGSHSVTATIATDTNYASATSAAATFAVNVATPVAQVPSSTIQYGTASAQLTAIFAFTGQTAPSGLVTFTVNNATFNATCTTGTASPRTCSVTYNSSALAAGTYTIQASEAADGNYAAASGSGTLTVSTGTVPVSVSSVSSVYGAASVPLSATFNFSGSTGPTGQVNFIVNNGTAVQANCTTSSSSRTCFVSYPLPALSGGSYTIQAQQAGDSNFGPTTGSGTLTVTPAAPTLSPAALTAVYGSSGVQLTAAVAYTGSAAPAGQPTFTVNNGLLVPATCTGSASPRACTGTLNATSLAVGQYPVSFSETADTNYSSTSASTILTISKATPTVTASNASASFGAASTTLSAAVSFTGSSAPAGGFAFSIDGGAAIAARCTGGSPTLTCTATATTSSLSVGSHAVVATESGDANYNAASGNATLTVAQGATALTVSAATGSAGGSAVTLTATQTFSGAVPTGLVSILVNGTTLAAPCTGTTSPRTCSASFDVSKVAAGSYTYSASSAADGSYTAAASNTSTVTLSSSNLTLTAQPVTSTYGVTPLTLTASLAYSGSSAPTGATSFLVDSTTSVAATCSGATSPQTCTGSYTGAPLAGGRHTLQAVFNGDTTYAAATSSSTPITINLASLTAAVTSGSVAYGAATTTLTATISFTGPVAPTGRVQFQVNGGTPVTAFCNTGTGSLACSATYASSALPVGQVPVTVTIAADSNYAATTSPTATLTVSKATPALTLAAVIAPYGSTLVNLVATFSNLQTVPPSGAVTFLVDGTPTATPSCTFTGGFGSCTVSYNAAALPVGPHQLVVTLAADVNYNQTTASTALSITQGTPQITAPAVSVANGSSSATLTAAVAYTGAAVPSGRVTFTLAGSSPLPATCTGASSPLSCAVSISLSSVPAGSYTLTAAIAADTNYAAAAATTTLTIAPGSASTFPTCTLGSIQSVSATSNAVSVTTSCTDPANLKLTSTINWGDGTVVAADSSGVSTHTYASPAVQTTYTVVLTATNTAGSAGTAVQTVAVYPAFTVSSSGSASVSTVIASQPPTVAPLQLTLQCKSVSTNASGQNVTNALPSSLGIVCSSTPFSSTSSAAAQISISPTAARASLLRPTRSMLVEALLLPFLGLPFLGLPFLALAGGRSRGKLLSLALIATAFLCLTMSGCGGSFNPPVTATPKGTYYITVTDVPANGSTPPTGFVQTSLIVPLVVQ